MVHKAFEFIYDRITRKGFIRINRKEIPIEAPKRATSSFGGYGLDLI